MRCPDKQFLIIIAMNTAASFAVGSIVPADNGIPDLIVASSLVDAWDINGPGDPFLS